jgi:hypothetical protein
MSIRVIGTGFGRTGNGVLKRVLERNGFGPTLHGLSITQSQDLARTCLRAVRSGAQSDISALLGPAQCTVGWPGAYFWRNLVAMNPSAKVIHTTRDPNAWYDAMRQSVCARLAEPLPQEHSPDFILRLLEREMLGDGVFSNRFDDKDHVIGAYRAHEQEVRAAVPADRLLIVNMQTDADQVHAFLGLPQLAKAA